MMSISDSDTHLGEFFLGDLGRSVHVHHRKQSEHAFLGFTPEKEVSSDTHKRDQCEVLVNGGNPLIKRIFWGGKRNRVTIDPILAFGGLVNAGKSLDQCGFAGAVITQQTVPLPTPEVDANVVESDKVAEAFADVLQT